MEVHSRTQLRDTRPWGNAEQMCGRTWGSNASYHCCEDDWKWHVCCSKIFVASPRVSTQWLRSIFNWWVNILLPRYKLDGSGSEPWWVPVILSSPHRCYRPLGAPNLLYSGYRVSFPGSGGCKAAKEWRYHPTPSSAEVKYSYNSTALSVHPKACYAETFIFTAMTVNGRCLITLLLYEDYNRSSF